MLPSKQNYMFGILDFQSSQQTNRLQRIESDVNVVSKEDILVALHLVVVWKPKVLEQPQ